MPITTIIIFDLDDTLVNCKMKMPRQTYHMLNRLKKLNYIIGVITYNCMVGIVAKETNLYKYTEHIYYANTDRDLLFEMCVNQIINDYQLINVTEIEIHYIDDKLDNLLAVKTNNKTVITHHCPDMYKLYKLKHQIATNMPHIV